MSSTYSTSLRIELQGSGENSGTWGTITNNNFSQSLEFSIAGVTNVACGDAAVTTLTNADGPQSQANNQARNAHIRLTGAHGAVRIAQFPATQKNLFNYQRYNRFWIFRALCNDCKTWSFW